MSKFSRRNILAAGAAGGSLVATAAAHAAGVFGNPDAPSEGMVNTKGAFTDPGPQNSAMANNLPSFENPPATDVGGMPPFWSSFNIAPKRVQDGGWARQVSDNAFPISTTIAGVNMRLNAGGIRELHWHQAAEWAVMVYGNARITTLDAEGRPSIADVKTGDLWYFPPGLPHSLQGLGPDGAEFVLAFDNGAAGEYNTLLLTEWMAHTPPEVLAKNFGIPVDSFKDIPLAQRWIFQSKVPGSLAADQAEVAAGTATAPVPYIFRLSAMKPNKSNASGTVQIADSTNFAVSKTVAAALVTVKPGGMREMHWHPNADEWQYYVKGVGRMTVFDAGPAAVTGDFRTGDIGYVKKSLGHYIENTGTDDLVFLEIFKADKYEEVSLTNWLAHSPKAMVAATLNMDLNMVARFAKAVQDIVPA